MPSPLTPDQQVDFVKAALPKYQKKYYTNISYTLQDYVGCREIFNEDSLKESGRRIMDSGHSFEWRVKVANDHNFAMSEMFAEEDTNLTNVLQSASLPWRKPKTSWGWDIDEPEFQSTEATKILDVIELREENAMQDWWENIETQVWSSPASSSDNKLFGIPFWMVKAANGEEGFVGGAPSGHTTVAGLNPSTYTQWKNYGFDYAAVSHEDLLAKLRRACYKTRFKAPAPVAKSELGVMGEGRKGPRRGHYTTYDVRAQLVRICQTQNDNLGAELAKYEDEVRFLGNPVTAVPYLDANDNSASPWYGINWSTIRACMKKGRNMHHTDPITPPGQPSTREVYVWSWCNIMCVNRRENFVGAIV